MIRETPGESAMELAAKRLERAVAALEQQVQDQGDARGDLFGRAPAADGELAAALERSRSRERELEAAGAEASAALGRAISEIRAALGGAGGRGD